MQWPGEILSKLNDRLVLNQKIVPFTRRNKRRAVSRQNNLCLFCYPRGGSTWLAEILLNLPGAVLIDEPLWRGIQKSPWRLPEPGHGKVAALDELHFFYYQHIPESAAWQEATDVFREILAGRVPAKSLYDEQDLSRLKHGGLYITKFCYANQLMPWLVGQLDFKAILLTRHPCAVVASQLKHPSWKQLQTVGQEHMPHFPFSDLYEAALGKLGRPLSVEAYLALQWGLGFRETAMHRLNNQKWLTIAYESLVLNFKEEIDRINQRFGFHLNAQQIDQNKRSKSVAEGYPNNELPERRIDAWQKELSPWQKDEIFRVLQVLDIDIYGADPAPNYSKLYSKQPAS